MGDAAERLRIAQQLRFHDGLLDHIADAVVATDANYRITGWNAAAERLYGFTAEQALGRHAREIATYDGDQARLKLEAELARTGHSQSAFTAVRKNGARVEVELIAAAVHDERGEIAGYLGIHRDITDRTRAEKALRAAQRQSDTILESISDAFVSLDRSWRYTRLNDRALERLSAWTGADVRREDVLGKTIWSLFPAVRGSEVEHKMRDAMHAQSPVDFELYFEPTDEWVDVRAFPSPSGLSIYYRNATKRKRAEDGRERSAHQQALLADLGLRALASEQLQPLLEEAAALIARTLQVETAGIAEVVPPTKQILLRAGVGWQEGAIGVPGAVASEGSLMGHTIRSAGPVVSEHLAADERFELSPLVAGHGFVSAATVVIAGRDDAFGALGAFSTGPHRFSDQDLSFMQGVANVLAAAVDRNQADDRLREVRESERRRIARDLHDGALQDATEALVIAQAVPAGAEKLVPILQSVGEHLRDTVHNLRLEEHEDRPLPDLLAGLVALHASLVADCDVALEVGEGTPVEPFGQSGTALLRIVGEALTNARRHAAAHVIGVRTWVSSERLVVEVSDDGRGFDPDSAGDDVGTGIIGMRERAALLHAHLTIESAPGSGARVRLGIPLPSSHAAPRRPIRVLLVEDHVVVRQAIAAMFERDADFEIIGQAGSVAGARPWFSKVDVALVDLGLPDGYGGDLIKELRRVNPQAQALVLTASVDRDEVARAVESGAAGTLNKSVDLDHVVDGVRKLWARETLLPLDEVVELLRVAGRQREQEAEGRRATAQLTPREREVLQALADGLDSRAIAKRLHISVRTERNHVASILSKLGAHSRLQALVVAVRYGAAHIRQAGG